MKDDIAVRVENVSKQFRLGEKDVRSDSFATSVGRVLTSPLRNYRKYRSLYQFDDLSPEGRSPSNVLWALRDVSFEVKRGEVLGLIGTNGAGKSTLLKVLSRITPPSSGRISIRGRVSSLLEVGTGFHPELTGRENVYLNGTVMGMRKFEVDQRFDEIVDFSGVETFLDTPVKRYSSGMRVRLAFAVAAHLEPEILIIDEVLAVGDAAFQKKCLNKMEDVGQEGRTVLFVSHNMPAVTRLCTRALLLHEGKIVMNDSPSVVVGAYLNADSGIVSERRWPEEKAPGGNAIRLRRVRVKGEDNNTVEIVDVQDRVGIEVSYDIGERIGDLLIYIALRDHDGHSLFTAVETSENNQPVTLENGSYVTTAWIPSHLLNEGTLYVTASAKSLNPNIRRFIADQVIAFQVVDHREGVTARGRWAGELGGAVRPLLQWETHPTTASDG